MPKRARSGSSVGETDAKRRKVRKGTHSCWQCRKRKIRCKFASDEAPACIDCEARGVACVSQEYEDEQPPQNQDSSVAQRVGRMEGLLEQLVERLLPGTCTPPADGTFPASAGSAEGDPGSPADLTPFSAGNPPMLKFLGGLRSATMATTNPSVFIQEPAPTRDSNPAATSGHARISKALHALMPCSRDVSALVGAIVGVPMVFYFFSNAVDGLEKRTDVLSAVLDIPSETSHPAVIAKSLMCLANCMQQLPPQPKPLLLSAMPLRSHMAKMTSAVSDLVAYNDDLVGCFEGLEALILLAIYHANAGNMRKAWLSIRRSISVAQLMGIDRIPGRPLKSVNPNPDSSTRIKNSMLWFRMNIIDRHISLLLGLPAATAESAGLSFENNADESSKERLERHHMYISAKIIQRNCTPQRDTSFNTTQMIDCELEEAAKCVGPAFWHPVNPDRLVGAIERMAAAQQVMLQMNHYHLLILLHLPYMLRDPRERRWDYSKATCTSSSRALLRGFLVFRRLHQAMHACRHADYGALTAAMTLLLGYLDPPKLQQARQHGHGPDSSSTEGREADRRLVQAIRDQMREMDAMNDDKLSRESADIITRLLPLTDCEAMSRFGADESGGSYPVRLEIPYLGVIHIKPRGGGRQRSGVIATAEQDGSPAAAAAPAAPPTPAATATPTVPATDPVVLNGLAGGFAGAAAAAPAMEGPVQQQQQQDAFAWTSTDDFAFDPMQTGPTGEADQYTILAAEADDWTFQGFDHSYFETLFSRVVPGG
ncbi:hypothetical protein GGR56DRAFT_667013 [Xylariaceae sp. FL0804]|nr:hypothetical protein GGR56DRAFT_667013 [Xylariaceae sp. FL0804]